MLNLLFPRVCNGCKSMLSKGEELICINCRHKLPLLCHHKTNNFAMKDLFYGRFPIEQATALLQFQKRGITQELLHNLKYRKQKDLSSFFGKWLGAELAQQELYNNIDIIIPVPLHKQKLRKRGYNQVEGFGKEIAKALKVPYNDKILLKITKTGSQVFKQRLTRFQTEEIFTIKQKELLKNKHILLVDDIVTTGATLENCALHLLKDTNAKLSIATIAIA
jgi:ComF family protein